MGHLVVYQDPIHTCAHTPTLSHTYTYIYICIYTHTLTSMHSVCRMTFLISDVVTVSFLTPSTFPKLTPCHLCRSHTHMAGAAQSLICSVCRTNFSHVASAQVVRLTDLNPRLPYGVSYCHTQFNPDTTNPIMRSDKERERERLLEGFQCLSSQCLTPRLKL